MVKIDSLRVPRIKGIDKRIKLTEADRAAIIEAHNTGASINGLAREYGVSKRLVQFILYPERQKKNVQDRQARGGSTIYYERTEHHEAIKNHRTYKRELREKGII